MKSLVAAGATVAILALAGCSYVNPITTQNDYSASDGIHLEMDSVEALNLIVFTTGEGEPATLTGTLVNRGDEDAVLDVSIDGTSSTTVEVAAGESVTLSPIDGVEVSGTSPVLPGLTTQVGFVADQNAFFTQVTPVLDGTLPEYTPYIDAIG